MISTIIFKPIVPLNANGTIEPAQCPTCKLTYGASFMDTARRIWRICGISVEIGTGWSKTTISVNLI